MSTRFLALCVGSLGVFACSGAPGADTSASDTSPDTASLCPSATGPAGFFGSCSSVDAILPTCEEYTGLYWGATATDQFCRSDGGQFSASDHCPTAGLTGKCLTACGQPAEELEFVYAGEAATASVACETIAHGKWLK